MISKTAIRFAALCLGLVIVAASGCDEKSAPPGKPGDGAKTSAADPPAGDIDPGPTRPAIELLETAVERRLHPDRVESSSFLWNDWNRFQENYHPIYLIDDDPMTAWVEGASGDGAGEWVRVHLTEVAEATTIRVRVRNGYHKSKSLHKKNARAKAVVLTAMPAGARRELSLADDMEWQTIELEQPAGPLEALELEIVSVFPGTKYADLCISDVEIFVTSRTPENPAFEKKKFESVRAWKAERLEAAKLFASGAAKEMPIGAAYRVVDKKEIKRTDLGENPFESGASISGLAAEHLGDSAEIKRAKAAFETKFADWVPVSVAVKGGRRTPAIDGLYTPDAYEIGLGGHPNGDGYGLPAPNKVEFLTSSRLAVFESAEKTTIDKALEGGYRACEREETSHYFYFQPPAAKGAADGVVRELLIIECGQEAERDGYYPYAGPQLLEYDDSGKLIAAITNASVTTFGWSSGTSPKIIGGRRVRASGESFVVDRLEARN